MIQVQTTEPNGANFLTWIHGYVEKDGTIVLKSNPGNITDAWNEAGQRLTIPQPGKLPPIKFSKD